MRKIVAIAAACLFVASLIGPASGAPSDRKVTKQYTMANGMVVFDSAEAQWSVGTAWKIFRPEAGERFVSVSVSDEADQPVYGHIHLKPEADGKTKDVDFCNETTKPIRLGAAKKIDVAIFLGTCSDGTPSVVTEGTITATFSK